MNGNVIMIVLKNLMFTYPRYGGKEYEPGSDSNECVEEQIV